MNRLPTMQEPQTELCPTHGEYQSVLLFGEVRSRCPACENERAAAELQAAAARESEAQRSAWLQKVGHAEIPERFKTRKLSAFAAETPDQKRVFEIVSRYCDEFEANAKAGRSLIFIGPPGTGKTHLACGIVLQVIGRYGRTALYAKVPTLLRRVKETWSRDRVERESDVIRAYAYPDLLVLDEVGVQFGTEAERVILFDVINERYEHGRPTVLISNLDRTEVQSFLGERAFDRLREGGGELVVFSGDSYRGRI